ncbi:MAG: 3,4-dihydroxy-2-butanone-4-phosphate synthase, partial [Bdellovibrionales bacterium]|nr:3,4-dihydroxy-2-butanone-4-phosphate synthase [Bdellovibrionales bacterium]
MSDSISKALHELSQGRFVLVCDSESREDEADLIMAAEFVTTTHVNFMINNGRGLICVPLAESVAKKLNLPLMVREHAGTFETAFTVSVDVKKGTHTGISSPDRAATIRALSDSKSSTEDFARPGHVFPLIAWEEGVLVRPGHTEASVDLMKLAGLSPVAVLCETLDEFGLALKGQPLRDFALKFNIPLISI